ncbi:MAG: hypothetical protein IPM42_14425 [Saprospiraceae bacterium]|nr:hypothetical protein [Saprospiraceae bacterium]
MKSYHFFCKVKSFWFCLLFILSGTVNADLYGQQTKAKIMVLGSYHMANPGADVFNMQADDVLSPHRQKEMEELVSVLLKFKPTKIVLEVSSKTDSLYNASYQSYIEGNHKLTANEAQQLGFRLAKYSGHKKVFCVDETGKFDFDAVMQFAMQNGQGQSIQTMMGTIQNHIATENKLLLESTLIQYFKHMNSPENQEMGLDWYMKLLNIADGKSFPGPELVSDVYERNLKIMSNIFRLTDSPEDRILVIYGNGHTAFFKSILLGSEKFDWVDVFNYFPK